MQRLRSRYITRVNEGTGKRRSAWNIAPADVVGDVDVCRRVVYVRSVCVHCDLRWQSPPLPTDL